VTGLKRNFSLNKSGFTLLELILVILLIGILGAVVLPNLNFNQDLKKDFVFKLNSLNQITLQSAITTGKLHRVFFDYNNKEIRSEVLVNNSLDNNFEPIKAKYFKNKISWDIEEFSIKDFFIADKNEFSGDKLKEIWYYIFPESSTQPVIINFMGLEKYSLVLNPFTSQFKEYDFWQYPV